MHMYTTIQKLGISKDYFKEIKTFIQQGYN